MMIFWMIYLFKFLKVPKTFHSTVALQVGFLKHLGDVATVLLVLFLHVIPDRLMMIRSDLCVEHKNLTGLLQLMAK